MSERFVPPNKPFFVWLNPTRMHVVTHVSDKYESMRTSENGWSIQEAGMAQIDDIVGSVMTYLQDNGLDNNIFTTDNGAEPVSREREDIYIPNELEITAKVRCVGSRAPHADFVAHMYRRPGSSWTIPALSASPIGTGFVSGSARLD